MESQTGGANIHLIISGFCEYFRVGISHVNNLFLIAVWNSQVHLHSLLWDLPMLVSQEVTKVKISSEVVEISDPISA